jgi:hypothetical protein
VSTSSIPLIDRAITRTRDGELTMQALLWVLASSVVLVASRAEVGEDLAGFEPVLYDGDGESLLSVFTAAERADAVPDQTPFLVALTGEDLVRRMPDGFGLIVNPGNDLGFQVPARGVAAFRTEISI